MGRKLAPILVWSAAVVLIALGLLTVWLPIPTGVPLLAAGLVLILATSRQAVRWLRARRRRNLDFNRLMSGLEDRAPAPMAQVLRRSRPRLPAGPSGPA
jgi:fatty acid desaturase